MAENNLIKLYPPWKQAAQVIAARVEAEGYGLLFTFEELHQMMDLKPPSGKLGIGEWRSSQFEWLQHIENLKDTLLEEYNLGFMNKRGIGYLVLHPNDQVMVAVPKRMHKAMLTVNKAIKELTHVNQALLSYEAQQAQFRNMEKVAFVKAALSKKRNLSDSLEQDKIKQLTPPNNPVAQTGEK